VLLQGKSALVTGGASGIGEACVRLFAAEGASVLIADFDPKSGQALAAELSAQGHACHYVNANVTSEPSVEAMVAKAMSLFGRLDCAVNSAGIGGAPDSIENLALADWQRVMDVNLTAVFLCLKHELKAMLPKKAGSIVNISSGAGLIAVPNMAAYCATKHGVLGLSKTAATENLRTGVRVNSILPGSTRTPMTQASMDMDETVKEMILASARCGRLAEPIEIAQNVAWLCSDRASYVSGESICVDYATVCR
jgi:NAD(P)-dependent dehydrogenase (short-subunit alcohol dehydrogenase family)